MVNVSIYTSTMDPMGYGVCNFLHRDTQHCMIFLGGVPYDSDPMVNVFGCERGLRPPLTIAFWGLIPSNKQPPG